MAPVKATGGGRGAGVPMAPVKTTAKKACNPNSRNSSFDLPLELAKFLLKYAI
jgi:hypothetical protein